jgi:hypothetical protein
MITKITSFYTAFFKDYYSKYPEIANMPYRGQYQHLMAQGHA